MSADPTTGTRIGDLYYTFSGNTAKVIGYASSIDWSTFTTIPDTVSNNGNTYTVTKIGNNAFQNCSSLALTSLPTNLIEIEEGGFQSCTSLALTSLPSSLTTIGYNAFQNCSSLALTSLPDSVTTISNQAFQNCSSLALTSLPAGLSKVNPNAFNGCSNLKITLIPSNITNVGYTSFTQCSSMETLIIQSSPTIGVNAFSVTGIKEVLNLGSTEITTTSYGLNADEVRSDVPALGYIAPLSDTVIVQKEGAIFDVLSLLPLVAGIGLLMFAVIYALERRYV